MLVSKYKMLLYLSLTINSNAIYKVAKVIYVNELDHIKVYLFMHTYNRPRSKFISYTHTHTQDKINKYKR